MYESLNEKTIVKHVEEQNRVLLKKSRKSWNAELQIDMSSSYGNSMSINRPFSARFAETGSPISHITIFLFTCICNQGIGYDTVLSYDSIMDDILLLVAT